MSAEDSRTENSAVVLNKVATAAFPAVGLAPWMSHYPKREEAVIVGIKTIADVSEELERQAWRFKHPDAKPKPESDEEEIFDLTEVEGAAYIFGYGLNRLAMNMHNFAPSIDGMRTKQAIALAKANNPGLATTADQPQKKSAWQRMQFWKKGNNEQ